MTKPINTSLIIPTYNPAPGWEQIFLERYRSFCKAIGIEIQVVLVNDGSQIGINEAVQFLEKEIGQPFKYVSYEKNRGKGGALKAGVSALESQYYIFTDIDFPYSTDSMKKIYKAIHVNSGVVSGFRAEMYYEDVSSFRTILSKGLRILNKTILGLPTNDTQCGLKAFDYQVKEILLSCETERFLIDLELLLAVNKRKINILPVEVVLRDDIEFTKFNASVLLKEVFSFFKLIVRYRIF